MNQKNCMVAQSGGPTVAINASLAGVIDGVSASSMYDTVYGSLNGITGILNDDLLNLTELMDGHPEYLSRLAQTPAMYLGSCRYKLPHYLDDDSPYVFIFKQFETYHIEAFFYIGGNDSMDTVLKLSEYGKRIGSSVRIIGIPKTIDNDLCETDHTPGFGSAAKYIASSLLEIAHDTFIYAVKSVTIVEIMGRHAGWLTAASVLARKFEGDNPVLIYLPEVAFSPDAFIEKVKEKLTKTSNLVVCISEGINDGNGTFVCELASDVGTDTFGHKMLTGSGKYLENLVKEKLGIKVRSVELNVCQRCSSSCLSATDLDEAAASGRFAVSAALDGETGKMINFIRKSDDPYILEFGTADVNEICNKEKAVPEEWITKDGSDIGDEFIAYARPLIQGSVEVPMKDGLPYFAFRK